MQVLCDWLNQLSATWWNWMVHAGCQAALVGVSLLILVHLFGRRWPAPLRYALLVVALLKFACPPLLPLPTGIFSHLNVSPPILLQATERKPALASSLRVKPPAPETARLNGAGSGDGRFLGLHWTAWLMLLHGVGIASVGMATLLQLLALRRLTRQAGVLRLDGPVGERYRSLALQLGVFRIPLLAVSDDVAGPIACGPKNPRILIPSRLLERLSPAELNSVLAHELAHCHRGDLWLNWVQQAIVAMWWFHPVLWLLHRSLQNIREDCCDDLLLARGVVSNDAYCDLLLRAASEAAAIESLAPAVPLVRGRHPLARRLVRITDWNLPRFESVPSSAAAVILLVAAFLWPGESLQPKRLASAMTPEKNASIAEAAPALAPALVSEATTAINEISPSDPQEEPAQPVAADLPSDPPGLGWPMTNPLGMGPAASVSTSLQVASTGFPPAPQPVRALPSPSVRPAALGPRYIPVAVPMVRNYAAVSLVSPTRVLAFNRPYPWRRGPVGSVQPNRPMNRVQSFQSPSASAMRNQPWAVATP